MQYVIGQSGAVGSVGSQYGGQRDGCTPGGRLLGPDGELITSNMNTEPTTLFSIYQMDKETFDKALLGQLNEQQTTQQTETLGASLERIELKNQASRGGPGVGITPLQRETLLQLVEALVLDFF